MSTTLPPWRTALSYAVIALFVAITVLPFVYMVLLSLQTEAETFAGVPVIVPAIPQWHNYVEIWKLAPFGRFLFNSFFVAGAITLSHLFFDPLSGYVFAKYEFPLKHVIFLLILGTLMIPFFVRMIPLYVMMSNWGWLNTYQALIVPFLMSAYGIFLMRQFIQPIPTDLIDAARLDGASEFGIYWQVILPQCKPALAALGLFTFVYQINEFIWPLIITNTTEMRTMTIGLTLFNQENFTQWQYTATGALILFVPCLALFIATQRWFVRGIVLSGLK